MSDLHSDTSFRNINGLRSIVEKMSSAIDSYEKAQDNPAGAEIARADIVKAAEEMLLDIQDPLKRLFLISHQVRKHEQNNEIQISCRALLISFTLR
jgi:hypothetical protein